MSIYTELKAAGAEIGNHESDLYVGPTEACPLWKLWPILKASGVYYTTFTNQITKTVWYDIPFCFDPWWEARKSTASAP